MQALIFRGPGEVALESRPDPELEPGEAIVRIVAAGVCGSDIHAIASATGRRTPGMILGHEAAGEVIAVGPPAPGRARCARPPTEETPIRPGDRVAIQPIIWCGSCHYCHSGQTQLCLKRRIIGVNLPDRGLFAERVRVPLENLYRLADGVPYEAGALAEPLAVGLHAARLAAVTAEATVLITGAGSIGLCALLCTRFLGAARVFITDPLPHKRERAERLGGIALAPADAVRRVREETEGLGADVAIDAVGSAASLETSLGGVRPDSDVVQVGMHEPAPVLQLYDLVTQERRLIGSYAYSTADFADAVGLINAGHVDVLPLIDERVALRGAPAAITALCRGESQAVKVIVAPSG